MKIARIKKGQEEVAGFAIILVIVSVILFIFFVIYLKKSPAENVQSYEVNSFIQSFLQYTTNCEQDYLNLSIQKLISECEKKAECSDGKETCDILKRTMIDVLDESWSVGEDYPVKGYVFNISAQGREILVINKGDIETREWKNSFQDIPGSTRDYSIYVFFKAYY